MYRYKERAFTFIELMISVTVLGVALLALLSGYMGCLKLNEISKHTTIATEHINKIIEQMYCLSVDSLTEITSENWTAWAVNNGCNSLSSENVIVTYTDRDMTGDPLDDDPLEVSVTVNWQDKGRSRSLTMSTLITVR